MTVIATEQSRDRGDFDEAQRLYALIEKADKDHPSLARLKSSVAAAEKAATESVEQQRLSAEQEDRQQVWQGKSVAGGVDIGGSASSSQKNKRQQKTIEL